MKKSLLSILVLAMFGMLLTGCQCKPRVSVLGDSYSTFRGWIPEGNAIYYPQDPNKNDVAKPEQCWWHLVVKAIGGELEKNESWSGSTICYTGYRKSDASAWSFVARTGRLGNPTHILVCGATNDSWAGVPMGDYKWSDWTREELFNFRPGMAKMLYDLKTGYPKAKVYFILNSQLSEDINNSVHEICNHYNVPCIDLHDIDKQAGHPSIKGMEAFAAQVVEGISKK